MGTRLLGLFLPVLVPAGSLQAQAVSARAAGDSVDRYITAHMARYHVPGAAILPFGFETLGLHTIAAVTLEANPASLRVLLKLGFVEVGRTTWALPSHPGRSRTPGPVLPDRDDLMALTRRGAAAVAVHALVLLMARPMLARADEVRIWVSRAIATVLAEIGPEFERSTGHRPAAARQTDRVPERTDSVSVIRAQGMEPRAGGGDSPLQSGPDAVMRQFFRDLSGRRWEDAAAALDLTVLGAYRESVLARQRRIAPQREPTVEDLLRLDPEMPRAVAEYQLAQRRRVLDEYPLPAVPEFPDIPSYDSLRALSPIALGISWLQGRDYRERMRNDLRRLKCPPGADSLLLAELTMDPKVLGVAGASDSVAFVLFSDPQFDRPVREFYASDPMIARMRRTAGGWRIIPTSTFLSRPNTISQLAACPGAAPRH